MMVVRLLALTQLYALFLLQSSGAEDVTTLQLEGDDDDGRITYFGFDVDTDERVSVACMHVESVVEVDSDGNAVQIPTKVSSLDPDRDSLPD